MTKTEAIEIIWDYMHMHHELQKSDIILALGSYDIGVGEYAAQLWLDGWAPYLVCTGSGTIHSDNPMWADFLGSTEAETFADIAKKAGVPKEAILIENQSQNTEDNFTLTSKILENKGIELNKVIAVHKPYMERRTYATGKIWWPNVDIIVTSPPITLSEYKNKQNNTGERWIHTMVGDLQRIKEYPAKGFQIEQDIPSEVWEAYESLIDAGYTNRLIK